MIALSIIKLTGVSISRGVGIVAHDFIKVADVDRPGVGGWLLHVAIGKMGGTRKRSQAITSSSWSSTWSGSGDSKDGSTAQKNRQHCHKS